MSPFTKFVFILFMISLQNLCSADSDSDETDSDETTTTETPKTGKEFHSVSSNLSEADEDDLKYLRYVNIAWRGGLHNGEPGIPYTNLFTPFPEPLGHLTKLGRKQMYEVGKFLRRRYGKMFNYTYDPEAVRFLSGDKNRTIESSILIATGMFPPEQVHEIWNEHIRYQPVPVHIDLRLSVTGSVTLVLKGECPTLQFVIESSRFRDLKDKWNWMVDYLCYSAKTKKHNFFHGFIVATVLNIMSQYEQRNETFAQFMPPWANETIVEKAVEFYWEVEEFLASWQLVNRISAGYILEIMINEMSWAVRDNPQRMFHGISSHDDSMHSLVKILNPSWNFKQWPCYAGFLALELHKAPGEPAIVKAFYWYHIHESPIRLAIDQCDEPCTLDKFIERSRPYICDNCAAECGIAPWTIPEETSSRVAGGLLTVCVTLLLVFIISLTCCLWSKLQLSKMEERRPLLFK